jgi:hypothetical protein
MANSICRWQCLEDRSQWLAAGLHARCRWRLPVLLMGSCLFLSPKNDKRHPIISWLISIPRRTEGGGAWQEELAGFRPNGIAVSEKDEEDDEDGDQFDEEDD